MVDNPGQIEPAWLLGKMKEDVTAGASAPEVLIEAVVERINLIAPVTVSEFKGTEEHIVFSPPKNLL